MNASLTHFFFLLSMVRVDGSRKHGMIKKDILALGEVAR
jgi:hypothetical protein